MDLNGIQGRNRWVEIDGGEEGHPHLNDSQPGCGVKGVRVQGLAFPGERLRYVLTVRESILSSVH